MPLSRRDLLRRSLLAATGPCLAPLPRMGGFLFAQDSTAPGATPARTLHESIRDEAEHATLALRFTGRTADECRAWQDRFRAKLEELLGESTPPAKWTVMEERHAEFDDHVRYELVLQSPGRDSVPLYLLVPRTATKDRPAPAVLCLHGHAEHGHHSLVGLTTETAADPQRPGGDESIGMRFLRRGYVVAAPCFVPFGRRWGPRPKQGGDPCAEALVRLLALGKLPIAQNLHDARWTLDLLQSRPEVDGTRLGCAGLSYGGRMTMLTTAIDRRIRVAVVSGALNLLQERISGHYTCGAQIVPGLLKYGDYSEIGSLIAPRPCVWEVGSQDGLIRPEQAQIFRERLERAYAALGAADQLKFDHFDGGHRWSTAVALPLFDEVLRPK